MSNFLSTLISREQGQPANAIAPRLPSRYEPREQKTPFNTHSGPSHHETLPSGPGWEAGSAEIGKLRQRCHEPLTPRSGQQSDFASTPPEPQQERHIGDGQPSVGTPVLERTPDREPSADISARAFELIHGYESPALREGQTRHHAPAMEMSEPVQSVAKPAVKGEAWAVPETDADRIASGEHDRKAPHTSPRISAGEFEPQRAAITLNPAANPPAPATRQSRAAAQHEHDVSVNSPSAALRSAHADNSGSAAPADESAPAAKPDDKRRTLNPRISPSISSSDSSILEQSVQHGRKQTPLMGALLPQETPGQNGNAAALPAASLLPAAAIAALRSHSTLNVLSRRELGTVPEVTKAESTINVSIGRIEIRAVTPPAAPKRGNQAPKPMSLDEYLNKSSQRGRR